jgi:threonine dehydrogenase-like Zn-dependent dehydrogenase
MVVDTARSALYPLPDGISFEQGCLARLAAISMQGVRLAQLRLGERAVVFGQGLIGQFARQLLALDGASTAIGVDLIDARLEVAQRDGATQTINPSRQNVADAVTAATQGHGADVVIEATGNPAVINDALNVAARLGRVVLLGSPRGRVEIDPYNDIHRKGVSLIGAHANTAALPGNPYQPWTMAEQILLAVELMRQGRLRTEHLITHRVPADQALGIFDALTERQRDHLGVIIEWQ